MWRVIAYFCKQSALGPRLAHMPQNDVLKRYLDAGLAFTALTQARAEALVKDLVKAGEVQTDQARDTVADLLERSRANSERLLESVRTEVKAQISGLGLASKADLDKLEARIAGFFGAKAGAAKTAPAKTAPAKTAAAKKAPVKKAPARKAPTSKAPAKRKAPAKQAAKKAPARKAPAKKRA
jgi:polyhydroxyalkanoate synthesis regulator phasin